MMFMDRGYGPVAPVSVLEQLQREQCLGRYNLVLSHNVVQHKKRFRDLNLRQRGYSTWLVDNSVIELGTPVEASVIAEACSVFDGEVVAILPDELLDWEGTIEVTERALKDFRKLGMDRLMFVPQGRNLEQIIKCAEYFQRCQEIKWIGVAKNFTSILGSRMEVTKILQSIFPTCKFHMLGFSRNTIDDILSTRLLGVEGIDSSMPLRCQEPISFLSQFSKRGDWWQENMMVNALTIENVKRVRRWLGQL